jgi:DNA replication protein DnaC
MNVEQNAEVRRLFDYDRETIDAVANRTMVCPVCLDRGDYQRKTSDEGRVETVFCACGRLQLIQYIAEQKIAVHDRFVRLSKLAPSDRSQLSIERQAEVLAELRAKPLQSYAFFGPAGTSKTTFCVALYRERALRWVNGCRVLPLVGDYGVQRAKSYLKDFPVYCVSAKRLLEDFHKESIGDLDENGKKIRPVVNGEKLARVGERGALFLEEIDKVRYSEFKVNALFELFDACYEHGVQLVFNTNLTPEKFAAQFGPETGPAIFRRIAEICTVYDFFPE